MLCKGFAWNQPLRPQALTLAVIYVNRVSLPRTMAPGLFFEFRSNFTKAVQTRRLTMGVADGTVEADGELIYQVKDMKVALSDS